MATLTAGSNYAVRMDQLDAGDLDDGTVRSQTSTQEVVDTGDGYTDIFTGSGFTYSDGEPTGGTVTGYELTLNGGSVFSVTGASVAATQLYDAVSHEDTARVLNLFFGGDDVFNGGASADYLDARGGNNVVSGGGGADTLVAGSGNNHVYGNALGSRQGAPDGNDTITVGDGTNYVNGNAGNDQITVGNGQNRVYGGAGDDSIELGNGNNTVNGNAGNDVIVAGDGYNVIRGGNGDDHIYTNDTTVVSGNVEMGDLGNDQFHTGVGYDLMTGGDGADIVWLGGMQHGSQAATIGGKTYYDEVTDFDPGQDHLVVRAYVPDTVLTSSQRFGTEAEAQSYAQSQLAASNDTHAVFSAQVGSNTMLFFNATGASTTIDSFLQLDGTSAQAVTTATFLDGSTF